MNRLRDLSSRASLDLGSAVTASEADDLIHRYLEIIESTGPSDARPSPREDQAPLKKRRSRNESIFEPSDALSQKRVPPPGWSRWSGY
jgi:hypothetical protein